MADIHILTGDGIEQWTIAAHYAIPDTTNEVSVNYRTALINSGLGGTSQLAEGTGAGQITTAEMAQIAAGELFEYTFSFYAESGATTNAQLLSAVRNEYNGRQSRVIASLQRRLKYYGWSGSAA